MNRIWIVGAGGRVGNSLVKLLDTIDHELFCTDIEEVDITDMDSVETYATMCRPNIIINCASLAAGDRKVVDVDKTYNVNALGARNLAVQAQKIGAKFVQMSTDDVFAGEGDEPYNEFDIPTPVTVYGKSKFAAENFVTRLVPKAFIIRSSWVYGIGEDYVDYVCRKLEAGEKVEADENETAVPTYANDVARVIGELITTERYGKYHVVPAGGCSRYEFAVEIAKAKGMSEDMIIPVKGKKLNTLLDGMMLRINGIEAPGDWKATLDNYIKETGGII